MPTLGRAATTALLAGALLLAAGAAALAPSEAASMQSIYDYLEPKPEGWTPDASAACTWPGVSCDSNGAVTSM